MARASAICVGCPRVSALIAAGIDVTGTTGSGSEPIQLTNAPPSSATFVLVCAPWTGTVNVSGLAAYSGERDQPFRLKMITDSGDRDHAVHGRRGPA